MASVSDATKFGQELANEVLTNPKKVRSSNATSVRTDAHTDNVKRVAERQKDLMEKLKKVDSTSTHKQRYERFLKDSQKKNMDVYLKTRNIEEKKFKNIMTLVKNNFDDIKAVFARHQYVIDLRSSQDEIEAYMQLTSDEKKDVIVQYRDLVSDFRSAINDFGKGDGDLEMELGIPEDKLAQMNEILNKLNDATKQKTNAEGQKRQKKMSDLFEKTISACKKGKYDLTVHLDLLNSSLVKPHGLAYYKGSVAAAKADYEILDKSNIDCKEVMCERLDEIIADLNHTDAQFEDNEVNLDRMMACISLVWRAKPDITADEFEKYISFYKGKVVDFINQEQIVKQSNLNRRIGKLTLPFNDKAGGGALHKYQSPFMVTPKRFGNGICCFVNFSCVGQLLNVFDDAALACDVIIACEDYDRHYIEGMSEFIVITPDEKMSYWTTRVTFWLLHSLLKGTTAATDFRGFMEGKATEVTFIPL